MSTEQQISKPFSLDEIKAKIASNDYNAELLLQHAMLLLAAQPQAAQAVPEGWRSSLLREFPLLDDAGLNEHEHCCEWALQQDRKRLHAMLAAAPSAHGIKEK